MRSNVTRRMSVRGLAAGLGFRFFSSSLARMKASMGLATQSGLLTVGGVTLRTAWKAQWAALVLALA